MCFKNREGPARCVLILNIILIVFMTFVLVLAVRLSSADLFNVPGDMTAQGGKAFTNGISFSIIGMITSGIGIFAVYYKKNRAPIVIHGIMNSILQVVFIIWGFGLMFSSVSERRTIETYCRTRERISYDEDALLRNYALETDFVITGIINENMCRRDVCPCPAEFEGAFNSTDELILNQFKRTKN